MKYFDILETTEEGLVLLNKREANKNLRTLLEVTDYGLLELAKHKGACQYCGKTMNYLEKYEKSSDEDLIFRIALKCCHNCRNWLWNCYEWPSYEIRHLAEGCPPGPIEATAWSKLAEFSTDLPEFVSTEIAINFRRNPKLWHMIAPLKLEKFLSDVFRSTGLYNEVTHIGRPGDGGADIVLIDAEKKRWLVSVKRRETPKKVEPVSTLRDIIGAMVLDGSKNAIIATTAGRFSNFVKKAKIKALQEGYRIELIDRSALDRLIENTLPIDPWYESLKLFSEKAAKLACENIVSERQLRLFD